MTSDELVAVSSSLDPAQAEQLYRLGIFPMPIAGGFGWFFPAKRAVVILGEWQLRCPRSTAQLLRGYRIGVDVDPLAVVWACATTPRSGGWIDSSMIEYYRALQGLSLLHSVEVRTVDGELVGGLFGVSAGDVFVGESMFHRVTNASKLAFFALTRLTLELGYRIIDGQWPTEHLMKLGFRALEGEAYAALLARSPAASPRPFPVGLLENDWLRLRAPV